MDVVVLYIFILGFGVNLTIQDKEIKHVVPYEKSCHLDEIEFFRPFNCSAVEGDTVKHQGSCIIEDFGNDSSVSGRFKVLTCKHGRWSGTPISVDNLQHRHKRFVFPVAVTLCALFCGGGGGGGTKTVTKYLPSFHGHCRPADISENYNVAAGDTSVVVGWTTPSATDRDGKTPRVTQIGGIVNGGRFEGAISGTTYKITYKATDSDGLKAYCYFSFTVTILTCKTLPWPANGERRCDNNNNILGTSCHYACAPGYHLTGRSTVTCENSATPSWSAIPTCEKITCKVPSYPVQSIVQCLRYDFRSVCSIQCRKGYTLEGPSYIKCRRDGTWSHAGLSTCRDKTPPTITCITPQTYYAERGRTSTTVKWHVPTAVDDIDPFPTVVKTEGPALGTRLEVGRNIVKYKAVDADGNESPECFIELHVEEIACDHPSDFFEDTFLVFNCSLPRYVYGVSCTLSCDAHLPLEGANLVKCEADGISNGVWNWTTEVKPHCKEIACPDLDPPINGALVYDTILTRPMYTMMCNEEFDIPVIGSNFQGVFFCTDDGDWTPFTNVPDCIEPRNPKSLHLPAKLYYFSGECGSDTTMAQIEKQFKDILESDLNPYFEIICPPGKTCEAEDVKIICGPIQDRKKRSLSLEYKSGHQRLRNNTAGQIAEHVHVMQKHSTHTHLLVLEFHIVMELKVDNTSLRDAILEYSDMQLNILKPAVQDMINNGTFDVRGFDLKKDSFQTPKSGDVKCPPGHKLHQLKCKPCPLGYFLNETASKCQLCSVGQYKDNESDIYCTSCPSGYSTKKAGSKSQADCSKLCSPGTYSPDTMESCSPCRHGYYQDEYGQTSCKLCPSDTTSVSVNSTSVTACKRATDKCLSSPCNGHVCTNGENNFTCTCQDGWSGSTCTVPPDFCINNLCENGATCISGETNYECTCLPGYNGTFCEIQPVNGDWSGWTSWSECSLSCGSGTRNRTRQCDSPPPDTYGTDCIGDQIETTACNVESCPVCKEFERKYGTRLNCSTDLMTGTEKCLLYCEKDKFLPPGLMEFQSYTCGPSTNYMWDSLDNPPGCVDPVGPDNVNITVNVDYTSSIPDNASKSFEDIIGDQISSVPCYNSPNCLISVEIKQFSMSLSFNIPLHLGPDIQYEDYISTGTGKSCIIPLLHTASGALKELIDAISFLELTAQYIQNNTNELFDVNVSGVTYTADVDSLTFGARVTCNSGFVPLDGICIACPSGTYSANGVCNFCEKATYQASTGQISCLPCPDGQTTSTIGSSDMHQCTEMISESTGTDAETTISTMKSHEHHDNDHFDFDRSIVFIAIGISTVALVVVLFIADRSIVFIAIGISTEALIVVLFIADRSIVFKAIGISTEALIVVLFIADRSIVFIAIGISTVALVVALLRLLLSFTGKFR
ncbi:sushi, von Willebrand factor type A, EGF and pentraxin domain-containing protein 1-like [Mercenaria mercenaria]|uniref:sushi, von Willebrand factor type A, EGF and pentraxin domain-containing protein 1-like n=1 Tax=Mercenaria mercenaria TaxID=6596 RepID=UPI00234E7A8F|nr:sushi, von Willebrand factor type A, EGF and pentraxin domain-containing protein 1-like [Mercenaria mercenaria]